MFPSPAFRYTLLLPVFLTVLISCGSTGPDTEMIEKTVIVKSESGEVLPAATLFNDKTDKKLGNGSTTLKREKGTSLSVRAEADGFVPTVETIRFASSSDVTITLSSDVPETVTISYEIVDEGQALVEGAKLFIADTLASNKASGSITLPGGDEAIELCAQAEYFKDNCLEVTPNRDQEITIAVERKMVEITISPRILGHEGYAGYSEEYIAEHLAAAEFAVRLGDSGVMVSGEELWYKEMEPLVLTYPMSGKALELSGEIVYNLCTDLRGPSPALSTCFEETYLDVARAVTDISLEKDQEITLPLQHVVACLDEVDNDGDGRTDREENGCFDSNRNYEPEDDVELLKGWRTTTFISGEDIFISSKSGEREVVLTERSSSNPQGSSIQKAVAIEVFVEAQVEADQSGEEFALRFATGSENNLTNVNVTDVVADDPNNDDWTRFKLTDVTKGWWSDGTYYRITAVYRGPSGNDGSDVFFVRKEDTESRKFIVQWAYEPEEVE